MVAKKVPGSTSDVLEGIWNNWCADANEREREVPVAQQADVFFTYVQRLCNPLFFIGTFKQFSLILSPFTEC
jgi:hypothetical protein